ncbi:M16 family metallopeptidase [Sulfurivermis fontis]|uniref:M16 family metallopeptidase n=1 Tax=Sulfurivermis fontis TaxID=1972068 RepID=UPI000FD809A9|nr:pitrilysin family protein [Sulfurivermis fontis]
MRSLAIVLLSGALLAGCATAPRAVKSEGPVHETTLANGLKVIVKEDHRAPVVVSQVWYKVGSSYEHDGLTGISHVLEHMMFKGTPNHPPGEFSRLIAAHGGRENAFTAQDYTAYFQQLEKTRLPIAFALEADRMRHLTLDPQEFANELKVVMEERRLRTDDNPQALTWEAFGAAAWQTSPYRHPIIGWMNDLEHLTVADLRRWYQTWYAPNNATLVVVGDVEPNEVFALAERHYGPLQPSTITPPKPRVEPPQRGARRIVVKAPAELPYLVMGYKVPTLKTADADWKPYALEVLGGVLDGGDSARLTRELVRGSQIAAGVTAGYTLTARLGDLFAFSGTPAQGHDVAALEQAIKAQIERLKTEPVSSEELARIKAQVTAGKVYELDSVFYQAMQIGVMETVGLDWRLLEEYPQRIAAVTPEQVMAVAREFFTDDNLTVAVLEPQPLDGLPPRAPVPVHVRH